VGSKIIKNYAISHKNKGVGGLFKKLHEQLQHNALRSMGYDGNVAGSMG
jgi:hypothetical protein